MAQKYLFGNRLSSRNNVRSIETLVLPKLKELGIDLRTIVGVASVDLKKDEAGLLNFAAKYNWEISFLLLKNYKMQQVNSVVLIL